MGEGARRNRIERFIKEYTNKVKYVLDFGGDRGQFIPDCFSDACRIVYNISENNVNDGIKLITNKDELKNYKWDFILCCHVLEHVSDVIDYFKALLNLMNEKSYLYIEVPNGNGIENNSLVTITEHLNFFTIKSFEVLAQNQRVKLIKSFQSDIFIQCLFCL